MRLSGSAASPNASALPCALLCDAHLAAQLAQKREAFPSILDTARI